MRHKRIISLILLLLALSGCSLQFPESTPPKVSTPDSELASPESEDFEHDDDTPPEPEDFEYDGLVLTLNSDFHQDEYDQLERMSFRHKDITVTVSHCLQDPIDSESRAHYLYNDLSDRWSDVTMKTSEDGFSYVICQADELAAYICGQYNYQNLGWLVEIDVPGTMDTETLEKWLLSCRPVSGSLKVNQAQTASLGALQLSVDQSFRQTTNREDFRCWVGAPYLLTVKRWQPDSDTTPEELAQNASEQQSYDRETVGIYNLDDIYCVSALGGDNPNIAMAYYMKDGYCYKVTLTGFPDVEVQAAVDLVSSGSMHQAEQSPPRTHILTVDHHDFPDLCNYIENYGLADEWKNYSIHINGLCTPVILEMEHLKTRSATAFGRTVQTDFYEDEGCLSVTVEEYEDELIILNGNNHPWVISMDWEYVFLPEKGVTTFPYVGAKGLLAYQLSTTYANWEDQDITVLLDNISSRGDLYSDTGYLSFHDGQPSYYSRFRETVSDLYDLDALFATAKAWGYYEQYDTLDDLLAANKKRGIELPSYPLGDSKDTYPKQHQGLTLELPTELEVDTTVQNTLVLKNESVRIQVFTGSIEKTFPELVRPVTAEHLLEQELQRHPEGSIGNYKGIPCIISPDLVSTYYIKGDQWWLVEATGGYEYELIPLVCCGSVQ